MTNKLTPAEKINNVVSALREIQTATKLYKIADHKERNAAKVQNSVELAKIAAVLRVQGSIDKLLTGIFDAAALNFAIESAAYCSNKGLKAIDNMANFVEWLAECDVKTEENNKKLDAECEAYNARNAPLPPMTKEQRRALIASV